MGFSDMDVDDPTMAKFTQIVSLIDSPDPVVQLETIRFVKNSIIGNKTKKALFRMAGAIPSVLGLIKINNSPEIIIQACAAVGSFATGDPESSKILLTEQNILPLLNMLKHHEIKVVEASVRSVKLILQSSERSASVIPQKFVPVFLELIDFRKKGTTIAELSTLCLARIFESNPTYRVQFLETPGVILLIDLLVSSNPKAQEASLDAISSLTFENLELCQFLSTKQVNSNGDTVVDVILSLMKDKRAQTRLLSATCLANMSQCKTIQKFESVVVQRVLPTLIKLMHDNSSIKERVPFVVAHLVSQSEEFQKAACDADAIPLLTEFVKSETAPEKMKQGSLLALAAICWNKEECRKQVIDSKVLPFISAYLSHPNAQIREASAKCIRSISKSAKNLRTSLFEAGVAQPLINLLSDESLSVKSEACAAICNIVLEFSPMKKHVIENNGIDKIVELCKSMDFAVRLNSSWALKNLLYLADAQTKEIVLSKLGFDGIEMLMNDSESSVQVQGLNILRNLVHVKDSETTKDKESLLEKYGGRIISMIERKLNATDSLILEQAIYVLVNVSVGTEKYQNLVVENQGIISKLLSFLSSSFARIRVASLWCIINLTWPEDEGSKNRTIALRRAGFENKLRELVDDNDIDVRDRVKIVLEQFESDKIKMES